MELTKRHIKRDFIFIAGTCLLFIVSIFTSCSDWDNTELRDYANKIAVTLKYSDFTETQLSTRDIENSDITVLFYDSNKQFISKAPFQVDSEQNGRLTGSIELPAGAEFVHFVSGYVLPETPESPEKIILREYDENILWGGAPITGNSSLEIEMIHTFAKISVSSKVSGFAILGYEIYGANATGSLAPQNLGEKDTEYSIPEAETKTAPEDINNIDTLSVFETANNDGYIRIIIKASYKDQVYFYPITLVNDSEYIDIVRNNHYKIDIASVNAEGWPSLEEAINASPENRLSVTITDRFIDITDIIACKDYALGVSHPTTLTPSAQNIDLFVISSYKGANDGIRINVNPNETWIKVKEITAVETKGGFIKYQVNLTIDKNEGEDSRSGKIKITSGDLSREIEIVQNSFNGEERNYRIYWPVEIGENLTLTGDFGAITSDDSNSPAASIAGYRYLQFKSNVNFGTFQYQVGDTYSGDIEINDETFTQLTINGTLYYIGYISADKTSGQSSFIADFPYCFMEHDLVRLVWEPTDMNQNAVYYQYCTYWFDGNEDEKEYGDAKLDLSYKGEKTYSHSIIIFKKYEGKTYVSLYISNVKNGAGKRSKEYTFHISEATPEYDYNEQRWQWIFYLENWEVE